MTTRDACQEIGKASWTESHVNYTILLQFTVSDKRICELSIREAKINKSQVFITLHNYSCGWHPTIVHKIEGREFTNAAETLADGNILKARLQIHIVGQQTHSSSRSDNIKHQIFLCFLRLSFSILRLTEGGCSEFTLLNLSYHNFAFSCTRVLHRRLTNFCHSLIDDGLDWN